MKGDKECEEHKCEYLSYCTWHPKDCIGKPWDKKQVQEKEFVMADIED